MASEEVGSRSVCFGQSRKVVDGKSSSPLSAVPLRTRACTTITITIRAEENPESAPSVIYAIFSAHSAYFNISRQKVPYFNVLRQKVPYFNVSRQKYGILMFCDKKYHILTFCKKTESYSTVLQQNNAEGC